jgi:hypothetical protein
MIKPRKIRCAAHVACMGKMRNAYKILVGEPEGKRLLGRHRHGLEENTRMDLGEVGWKIVV